MKRIIIAVTATLLLLGMMPPAQAQELAPTVVSITFDDGYAATGAGLDVMKQRGLRGTLYINSQRTGATNFFTRAQLKTYQDVGFEIGAHTLNHEDLAALTPDAAKANLCADRTNLMDLGFSVTSLAYPFGSYTPEVQQAARECGFNSARTVSGLKAPTSCANCPTSESIPPADPYAIRAPGTVQMTHTLEQLQTVVTQAENNGGGWVPIVFHHICDGCTTNSITLATFTAFMDWLAARPQTTTVKTVHEVIGGAVQPPPNGTEPVPDVSTVTVGTQERVLSGINVIRTKDSLILYTRVRGATTGTNQWGYEAAVSGGVVTQVGAAGNMAIPQGGYVLSGHGASATWLRANALLGTPVALDTPPPPPPPPPPTVDYPTTLVTAPTGTLAVTGVNVRRTTNALITYTNTFGPSTTTNVYGAEVAVVDGVVVAVQDKLGNMAIPGNGYVLSGHGTSRTWLLTNATVGTVLIPG